jgi:hypothetical protein
MLKQAVNVFAGSRAPSDAIANNSGAFSESEAGVVMDKTLPHHNGATVPQADDHSNAHNLGSAADLHMSSDSVQVFIVRMNALS